MGSSTAHRPVSYKLVVVDILTLDAGSTLTTALLLLHASELKAKHATNIVAPKA
jgi:hypothetical protein